MSKIPPDAYLLIIGAMKCGTSTLYNLLSQHPNICPCKTKEPEFFSGHQGRGLEVRNYSELWDFDPDQHTYALEASTGYTKYPGETNVARSIKKYGISPTFIYIVRDPFTRIESDYNFSRDKEWFNYKTPITADRYINISKYFMQLEQFRKYFPSEKIIVLDFDELSQNPDRLLCSLVNKLGLDNFNCQNSNIIVHKTSIPTRAQELTNRYQIVKTLASHIPASLKQWLKKIHVLSAKRKRTLVMKERNLVCEKLKDDIEKFGSHYHFPIEMWGF